MSWKRESEREKMWMESTRNGRGKYARVNHNCYLWPLLPHAMWPDNRFLSHFHLRMSTTLVLKPTVSLSLPKIPLSNYYQQDVHAIVRRRHSVFLAISYQSVEWQFSVAENISHKKIFLKGIFFWQTYNSESLTYKKNSSSLWTTKNKFRKRKTN